MESNDRHKGYGKIARGQKGYFLYLCAFLLIAIPFIFTSGMLQPTYATGGDITWQFGDTPRAGKQEAHAMAVDSAGYTVITGYSDQAGSEDYYTIRIKPDGTGIAADLWPTTYDNSGGPDHAEALAIDSNNNVIVTGQAQNATGDFDFHTIKYDSNGNVLWEKTFDGGVNGNDFAVAVAVGVKSGVDLDDVYVGGYTQNASGNDDFIILRYPAGGGDPVWQKTYNGAANGEDRILAITASVNGIAVTGESQNASLDFDCVTIKYDFDGNEVWSSEKRYDGSGSGDDRGIAVRMDAAGNVIMTGTTFGTEMDIYIVKYDGSVGPGTELWQKTYDGGNVDETSDLFIDSSDNLYVTGYHTFGDGSSGIYTVKYDSGGTLQWEDVFHSSSDNNDRAAGIVVDDTDTPDNSGAVFITGHSNDNATGKDDFLTIKYTINTGKLLWQENFNGSANMNDRSVGIVLTSSMDVVVAGWSEDTMDDYDFYAIEYKRGLLNRPTDLIATVDTTTKVDLTWTDNSSNETGFKIERKEGDFGSWNEIYDGSTPNQMLYSDTGVTADAKNYYRVRAYKSGTPDDNSNYSDEVYAVTTIQTYTPHSWKYTFDNLVSNEDKAKAVAAGSDYHPVVTGHSYSSLGTFDYYTVKLDRQSGSDTWNARYDGDQNDLDMATTIAVDDNNDVLVSGWSYLYSIAADENTNDIYTIKYPSTGPPADWYGQYSGPAGDDDRSSVVDVSTDGLNNYVVVGYGRNDDGNDDIYVIKYDTDGNVIWAATPYDGGYSDYPKAVAFDSSGDIIVTGFTYNGTNYDYFTRKYDGVNGLELWIDVYGGAGSGNDFTRALAVDSSGNAYVTGVMVTASGNEDFYTIKYDGSNGSRLWEREYNGFADGIDEAMAVKIDPVNGEIVVAGTTYTVNGENDFHTIRYDSAGNIVWQRTLDRPGNNDFVVAMGMDLSGNVHITGDTEYGESPTSNWDVLSIQYDHSGSFINGTIINGAADDGDGATSIAVNRLGEAFIGGYELNSNFDADYLVVKLDGDELQVPIPFEAAVHYVTVDFTWVDNSESETDYELQRKDAACLSAGTWNTIYNSGVVSGTGSTLAYTDDDGGPPGLTPGAQYCYRIRTAGAAGSSRWVELDITTVVLPPPDGLTATALNTTDIYLTWNDTTTSETVFNIERCEAAGLDCPGTDFTEIGEAAADAESYTDTTACAGIEYYYRINSQKATSPGWTSGWSNSANVTSDDHAAPDGLTATLVSEVQIDLQWTDNTNDETGFKVERCLTSSCTFTQLVPTVGLDSSIVMLLNMDEGAWLGSADEVADSSGSGNTGTAQNGATTVAGGQYGYAGSFDGNDDYVEVADSAGLNILDELTVELWFRPAVTYDSSLTDYVVLLDRQWSAGTDSYFLGINSDGKLHMGSNGGSIQSTQTTWTAGTWYHVVVTYHDVSGTYSGEMYINGAPETLSVNSYDNMAGGTQNIGIGGSDWFINFEGLIDRVAIYDRGLTASEAVDRFNNIVRYSDPNVPDVSENYTYQVRAYKTAAPGCGGEWNSAYSATASADSTITAPSDLTATALSTTEIFLTWTDNTASEEKFNIERCVDGASCPGSAFSWIGEANADAELYTDSTACAGITYHYRVNAEDTAPAWISGWSDPTASATTDTASAPIGFTSVTTTESQIDLQWTDTSDDESGFRIERCVGSVINPGECDEDIEFSLVGTIPTIPSGNVMLLRMDELSWSGTDDEIVDSSGSDNHGRAYNQATTDADGQIGRAGIFDGSGDYVSVPHTSSLEGNGDFTLELWIKPIDQNTWQGLIAKGGYRYLFALNDSGSNFRLAYYGSGWQYASAWHPYNVWTHVAVTFDGTNSITFYVNGQPEGTRTIAGNQASTSTLLIGQWNNNYWFEGLMDEVAIYDHALTDDEILERYKQASPTRDYLDDTGLLPSTTYTYRIWSYKTAAGCSGGEWESAYDTYVETSTTDPLAPTNLNATTINTTEIRLDWDDNTTSETGFEIWRCEDAAAVNCDEDIEFAYLDSVGSDVITFTDTTVCEYDNATNLQYFYHVKAVNTNPEWNETLWSNIANAETPDMMAPSGLVAETITEEQINIAWIDNTTDESGFKIERCDKAAIDCIEDDFAEVGTLGTTYGDLLVFHMDEASWGTVIDSSEGGSNNGTAYNGATTDPGGKFGRAGSFNGSNQYVTTPLNLNQSSSSPGVTMAAWVKPASISGDWHHVISTDDDGVEWSIARYGNSWRVLTGSTNFNSGFTVDVDEWQHIAAVFEPGVGITVYKNGAAASTVSIGYNTDDRNVMIGRRAVTGAYYFDGFIDEVALYNSPLSFTEIYQLAEDEWKEDTGILNDGDLTWIEDTAKAWDDNEWINYYVMMVDGDIAGESRKILSNTSNRLTIESFSDYPDIGDTYNIITYLKGTASGGSTTTVTDTGKNWAVNEWENYYVVMETGTNAGVSRKILSNTSDTLTVEAFANAVVSGNSYKILPYLQGPQSYGTKDTGTATGGSTTTVAETGKGWTTNEWQDYYVLMETGLNTGEISQITSNTSDTLTVSTPFSYAVAQDDIYKIVTSQSYTKRFSDTGLTIGQTYSYRVRGYKNSTCPWPVEYSNIDDATIVPPPPTNLTATSAGTTQIDLEWTDNTGTESGFKIYRCDGICTPDTVADPDDDLLIEVLGQAGMGVRSYYDTSVSPGVCESLTYSYLVVATSDSPSWNSDRSNTASATADTATAPSGFTATPVSESQVELSWNDDTADEDGFRVLRCEGALCDPVDPDDLLTTVEPDFEAFTDTGLSPGTDYNYEVHAYKTATCPWDKYESASASTSPIAAPVLTASVVNTTRIDLEWTDNTMSETGFTIERCEVGLDCPTFVEIGKAGPDVTEYSDLKLCNSKTYTYRVKPVNEGLSNSGGGCWTRRAVLTITDFQPNYQTKVEITAYDTDMKSDFSDIRFYDTTAGLELPYWIESKEDGVSATIYIKTLVNNTVYMYYGNTDAASSSNVERVYEFYDDFQGTAIDTAKWEKIDPNNSFTQSDVLILNDAGSDGWTKALISQETFDRAMGKEIYVDLTPYDTGGNNHFMVGWELNQSTEPNYNQLVHGFYWNNSSLTTYEKGSNKGTNGSYSYSWSTPYEMKIMLLPAGAKYYIKGGAYVDWTLIQETSNESDSPMRIAFTQHSHQADIRVVKVQNYAADEPSVTIGSEEQDDNCYTFSTWASPPYSDDVADTTPAPAAPSNLMATTVSDTRIDLTWTDNTYDETGFKIERCQGTGCGNFEEIKTLGGYDPSLTMLLRMDESSWHGVSGEVVDSAGSNNGTSHNGAQTVASGFDRSGSFDGSTDYVSVPASSGVNPTNAITVSLWAASDTGNWNATGTLASKRNAYMMYPVSGGKEIRFYIYTTLQWYFTTFTPNIDITQWHHYVGTYDGNEIKLYIDGAPAGTPTLRAGGINADPGALYIGRDDGQSRYFDGLIDEVAIYDVALTDTDVQALYTQGIASITDYSDTVSPSVSYCYQVRAYKTAPGCPGGEWNSGYSDSTCIESPPGTPTSLLATALNSQVIRLDWNGTGVDNEDGFELERKIWGGTYILIATLGSNAVTFSDTSGIEPETTYTYRIRAYNVQGESDYSNEASEITPSWQQGDDTCVE